MDKQWRLEPHNFSIGNTAIADAIKKARAMGGEQDNLAFALFRASVKADPRILDECVLDYWNAQRMHVLMAGSQAA